MTDEYIQGDFRPRKNIILDKMPDNQHKKRYKILVFTDFFGRKIWPMLEPMANHSQSCGCDTDLCDVTYNQSYYSKSHVVLFHSRDIKLKELKQFYHLRPTNQLWIYVVMENPYYTPDITLIDRYFNMTASYRLNSDIVLPYRYHHHNTNDQHRQPTVDYASGKTRQIAWAVSNCGHLRDQLVEKLFRHGLEIDNFGSCQFPFVNNRPYSSLQGPPYHEYKFVLAAENRLCQDYVTEKYWDIPFRKSSNTIPIVLGGANYSDSRLAIPGSFIDALSFSSPKKLADHLLAIDKNETLFNEYFKWKSRWTFYDDFRDPKCSVFHCDVCTNIHDKKNWKFRKKPLLSLISATRECEDKEIYFRKWIKRR